MIVIVEGPRGCGKTKLIELTDRALTKLNVPHSVKKFARGERPAFDMTRSIIEMEHYGNQIHLVDRFHLTEWVMRTYDKTVWPGRLNPQTHEIEELLEVAHAKVFYLQVDEDIRTRRVLARDDGRGFEMPAEEGTRLWNEALHMFRYHETLYNNTTAQLQDALDRVLRVGMKGLIR